MYIWLNSNNEIEFSDTLKPLENTHGIIAKEHVHTHNESYELTIPYSIRNSYEFLGISLGEVTIFKNERDIVVVKPKLHSKNTVNVSKMMVIIDMMHDGLDDTLRKHGYDAYSVKKLCEEQSLNLRSDFSLMKYAEKNNMIVVTEDKDNVLGCKENRLDCVEFGQAQKLEYLLEELQKIEQKRINNS